MNKLIIFSGILLGMTVLMCGCFGPSIAYKGQTFPQTTAAVFVEGDKTPAGYEVIGKCRVSGDYERFTLDELKSAILKKAASEGAEAVRIKSYVVLRNGMARESQITDMAGSNQGEIDDDSSDGWRQLDDEFDTNYEEIGAAQPGSLPVYKRVIYAEFLRKKP